LKRARNDVNTAIDYILRNPEGIDNVQESSVIARLNQVSLSPPIITSFNQISLGKGDKKLAQDNWSHLATPLANTTASISQTLETNLAKILQNTQHPMGKKVDMFITAFNANYQSIMPQEIGSVYVKATQEVHSFLAAMKSSITTKVNEFNSPVGQTVVWKVVEAVLFPGIFTTLFRLFQQKFQEMDAINASLITVLVSNPIAHFGVSGELKLNGNIQVYGTAIATLQGISYSKSIFEKLGILKNSLHVIVDTVGQTFAAAPSLVNAETVLPLYAYLLSKAQIPFLHSELSLLLEFIPEFLRTTQEAFALATLQATLSQMDKFVDKAPPRGPSQPDLISFEDVPRNYPSTVPFDPRNPVPSGPLRPVNAKASQAPTQFATLARAEQDYIATLKGVTSVDAYNQLAVYYNSKGKMLKAVDYCNKALRLDPRNVIALQNLAVYSHLAAAQGIAI